MQALSNYLADINELSASSRKGDKEKDVYIHPKLKNLGNISLVLIREAIAPTIFRNEEQEITDIDWDGDRYIRAVPNKFKYAERSRGLQILRAMGVGGRHAQNKTMLFKGEKPSSAFDLNTLVFGDSANQENRVLPVKAAVNYSDALSLAPKDLCVDESFHNRAMEDGTLFDAESKKNSDNLFTRHFIKPGTLMVQVVSTRGRLLPLIGLQHLLLSIGMAGAYGGQTSVTGVNIRTHLVGAYGGRFETALSSPYELLREMKQAGDFDPFNVGICSRIAHELMSPLHETVLDVSELGGYRHTLINEFEQSGSALEKSYQEAAPLVASLFDQWFLDK